MKKDRKKKLFMGALLIAFCSLGIQLLTLSAVQADDLRTVYKVGDGLSIGDGDNLLHIQGRVQGRFTFQKNEGVPATDGFAIQRGRIKVDGFTLEKKLKFAFQMDLATRARATTATVCTNAACTSTASAVTAESTTGLATLNDYYVDWTPVSWLGLQFGQFKVPFLMQELTSSGKQQFVDRSLATGFFNLSRDIGLNVHGDVLDKKLNYSVFFMNGDGANTLNRNNRALMAGTRIEVPILGEYKTSESDTDNSQEHNLGVGIAYAFNESVAAIQNGTIAADTKTSHGTLDLGYKYKGWSFQGAMMLSRSHEGTRLTNWGYNTQVGYFIIPKLFEVAVKTNGSIFSDALVDQFEHAVALNYFVKGHGIKWQNDFSLLQNNRGQDLNDFRARSQVQVIF